MTILLNVTDATPTVNQIVTVTTTPDISEDSLIIVYDEDQGYTEVARWTIGYGESLNIIPGLLGVHLLMVAYGLTSSDYAEQEIDVTVDEPPTGLTLSASDLAPDPAETVTFTIVTAIPTNYTVTLKAYMLGVEVGTWTVAIVDGTGTKDLVPSVIGGVVQWQAVSECVRSNSVTTGVSGATDYQVTIREAVPQGSGSTDKALGTYAVKSGTTYTITPAANPGYAFDYCIVSGVKSTSNPLALDIDSDHDVTPYFKVSGTPPAGDMKTLTVAPAYPSGSGSTDVGVGTYQKTAESSQTVIAEAEPGWDFDHWTIIYELSGLQPDVTSATLILTMIENVTVTPCFRSTYISSEGGGMVGALAELMIWSRRLSAQEVASLYFFPLTRLSGGVGILGDPILTIEPNPKNEHDGGIGTGEMLTQAATVTIDDTFTKEITAINAEGKVYNEVDVLDGAEAFGQADSKVMDDDVSRAEENNNPTTSLLGQTATGSSSTTIINNIVGSLFTTGGAATYVTSMTAYVLCTTANKAMKCAIYRHSNLALIAQTEVKTVVFNASGQWVIFPFASIVSLAASTDYIFVCWSQTASGTGALYYVAGSANQGHVRALTYAASFPATLTVGSHNSNQYCIFASCYV